MSGEQHVPTDDEGGPLNDASPEALAMTLAVIRGDYVKRENRIYGWHGPRGWLASAQRFLASPWMQQHDAEVRARPDRETIARAIDPDVWHAFDRDGYGVDGRRGISLLRADAVLALFAQEGQR